jgi:hypothetical protein
MLVLHQSPINLNVAKVEDALDPPDNGIFVSLREASRVKPRRQSGIDLRHLLRTLDNKGGPRKRDFAGLKALSSAFPWVNNTVKKDSFLDITGSRIQYIGNK